MWWRIFASVELRLLYALPSTCLGLPLDLLCCRQFLKPMANNGFTYQLFLSCSHFPRGQQLLKVLQYFLLVSSSVAFSARWVSLLEKEQLPTSGLEGNSEQLHPCFLFLLPSWLSLWAQPLELTCFISNMPIGDGHSGWWSSSACPCGWCLLWCKKHQENSHFIMLIMAGKKSDCQHDLFICL